MEIIKVTNDNFNEVINNNKKVLIDFNADWCGPCRMLAPLLEELSEERTDTLFASVNIDSENELANRFNIMSIPCLILFKDGVEVNRSIGLKPREEIEKILGD